MKATALKFLPQTGKTSSCTFPFVCHLMPSIKLNNPCIKPLVCKKKPFISFGTLASGFTLVELIVTLTIAAILMALAAPGMKGIVKDHRLSGQVNELLADINFARSEAIRRATIVTICKTTNPMAATSTCNTTAADPWTAGRFIFVESNSTGARGTINTGEEILRVRQALDGSDNKLVADATTANNISFSSAGLLETGTTVGGTTDFQMVFCDNRGISQARAAVISNTGRARIAAKGKNKTGGSLVTADCP